MSKIFNTADSIMETINNSGVQQPAIILNGQYLTIAGRRVYAKVVKLAPSGALSLQFIVKQYNQSSKKSDEMRVEDQVSRISNEISSNSLFGVRVSDHQAPSTATFKVNAEYGILIIESQLYQIGKKLQDATTGATVSTDNLTLSSNEASAIKRVFFEMALTNYKNVVYYAGTNKFAKHLTARNKLWGVRPTAFVPVFIDVSWLYNPFKNSALGIEDTMMYKMAVECGRYLEVGGVSAYFMTHLEICKAFGMTHFVRFSPSLWYNIFVGLLQPSNPEFPNKTTRVVSWGLDMQPPSPLRKQYSLEAFNDVMERYANEFPEELKQYNVSVSFDVFIAHEAGAIKTIGPTFIDKKENCTIAKLQEYYREAKLTY